MRSPRRLSPKKQYAKGNTTMTDRPAKRSRNDSTPSDLTASVGLSGALHGVDFSTVPVHTGSVGEQHVDDTRKKPSGDLGIQVILGSNGTIDAIKVTGRTPSPFGSAMGDHIVSWQTLVDSVHASLHGSSLPDAMTKLRKMQDDANASSKKLLGLLPGTERGDREGLLKNAAESTEASLTAAEKAGEGRDGAGRALAEATIASHLAYLNYLPFATVPAAKDRGSTGGREGTARSYLLGFERGEPGADVLPGHLQAQFDWGAALRESHIEYALDPSIAQTAAGLSNELADLAGRVTSGELPTIPRTRRAAHAAGTVKSLSQRAQEIYKSALGNESIHRAAPGIAGAAMAIRANAQKIESPDPNVRKRKRDPAAERREAVEGAAGSAARGAGLVADRAKGAPERAKFLLPYLMHKIQHVTATAYPASVEKTGFLADPAAALSALREALDQYPPTKGKVGNSGSLLTGIVDAYNALPKTANAASSSWAKHAGNDPLLVTYHGPSVTPRFKTAGRPPAPHGVEGMGSHTTAWVVEQKALNALVAHTKDDTEVRTALREAVGSDLKSSVMELDRLLPGDQLKAGQLNDLFDAASAVMKTGEENETSIEDMAASYLRFRNLLPFATVDAGGREGKGERSGASADINFDKESLDHAAALQKDALTDRKADAIGSLREAAGQLEDRHEQWVPGSVVHNAANASRTRLLSFAGTLQENGPQEGVAEEIVNVREREHKERFALANGNQRR